MQLRAFRLTSTCSGRDVLGSTSFDVTLSSTLKFNNHAIFNRPPCGACSFACTFCPPIDSAMARSITGRLLGTTDGTTDEVSDTNCEHRSQSVTELAKIQFVWASPDSFGKMFGTFVGSLDGAADGVLVVLYLTDVGAFGYISTGGRLAQSDINPFREMFGGEQGHWPIGQSANW